MKQLFSEIVRIVGLSICLQLYGLVHTLAANYGTDENKAKKLRGMGFFDSYLEGCFRRLGLFFGSDV